MKLDTKFDLFENVMIKELELTGCIQSVKFNKSCLEYLVRYFYNGEPKSYWMLETDIQNKPSIKKNKRK